MSAFMYGKRGDPPLPGVAGGGDFCEGKVKTVESLQIVEMQDAAGF